LEKEMDVGFCNTPKNCVEFYNIFFSTKFTQIKFNSIILTT